MTKFLSTFALAALLFGGLTAASPALAEKPPAAEPTAEEGKKIWMVKKNKCAKCHGEDGKAQTKMGKKKMVPDMTTAEWQKRFTDKQIMDSVLKGIDRKDGERKVKMKPLKGATEHDAKAILLFVRSMAPKK